MITKRAFGLYTLLTLILLLRCKSLGPFGNYLIAFSASSIGLIICIGEKKEDATN